MPQSRNKNCGNIVDHQRSFGNVMFSLGSVCLFTGRGGSTYDYYPLLPIGPQTSDMGPPPSPSTPSPPNTSDMRPSKPQPWPTLLVTSGWHHWRPVHLRTHRTSTDIWRPKYVWLASGRYASC